MKRDSELETDMVICSKCRTSLYKEIRRKNFKKLPQCVVSSEDSVHFNVNEDVDDVFNDLIQDKGFFGNGNDGDCCWWCLKDLTETFIIKC